MLVLVKNFKKPNLHKPHKLEMSLGGLEGRQRWTSKQLSGLSQETKENPFES
jgi:hypothetical protein